MNEAATGLPAGLGAIRDDFLSLDTPDRLQLLLEFSQELPPIPADLHRPLRPSNRSFRRLLGHPPNRLRRLFRRLRFLRSHRSYRLLRALRARP